MCHAYYPMPVQWLPECLAEKIHVAGITAGVIPAGVHLLHFFLDAYRFVKPRCHHTGQLLHATVHLEATIKTAGHTCIALRFSGDTFQSTTTPEISLAKLEA